MLKLSPRELLVSPLLSLVSRPLFSLGSAKSRRLRNLNCVEPLEVRNLLAANLSAILDQGQLTIVDTDAVGKNNSLDVSVVGTDLVITDANEQFIAAPAGGTLSNGDKTLTIPVSLLTAGLTINTAGGTDAITVGSLGAAFSGDLSIDGGAGSDSVTFQTGPIAVVSGSIFVFSETIDVNAAVTASGAINLTSTGNDSLLTINASIAMGLDSTLLADKMAINATITVTPGKLTLAPESTADEFDMIDIGSDADTAANTLQLSDAELDRITAGFIQIGDSHTGTVTVSQLIEHAADDSFLVTAGRNMLFTSGSGWATDNGGLTFNANNPNRGDRNFVGMELDQATLTSSGSGGISLSAIAGTGGDGNIGILIHNGSRIESNGTGSVTVSGSGGLGLSENRGIEVGGTDTVITSKVGAITMTGTAGPGVGGDHNTGVWLHSGATVSSTGSAKITIRGTSNRGANENNGVLLNGYGNNGATNVTTVNGDILIVGKGATLQTGSGNRGIGMYAGSIVQSTGSGKITLNGTGGAGTDSARGVELVDNGTSIKSAQGDIQIIGVGGDNVSGFGVWMWLGAAVESTGTAKILIDGTGGDAYDGDGVVLAGDGNSTRITSVNGDITVIGRGGDASDSFTRGVIVKAGSVIQSTGSATVTIDGTGGAGTDSSRGIEFQFAGTLVTSVTGDIQITGRGGDNTSAYGIWILDGAAVQSTGTAKVTIDGTGGNGQDGWGTVFEHSARVSSVDGAIAITGQGGNTAIGNSMHGLVIASGTVVESTGSATITLNGTGGTSPGHSRGVEICDPETRITSATADIQITGQGGDGLNSFGVWIRSGAVVESTGTAHVTITGTGGTGGGSDFGVLLNGFQTVGATRVASVDGDVLITGLGGNSPLDSNNPGVGVYEGAVIESTGIAKLTILGTGGTGTGRNRGVEILDDGSRITSVTGDIQITGHGGTGTTTENNGVWLAAGASVASTGSARITIDGTAGSGTNENNGVMLNGYNYPGATNVTAVDGDITIIGHGSTTATGSANRGIGMYSGAFIQSTGLAKISLDGTGGSGTDSARGVELAFEGTRISSATGDILLTGHGGSDASGYGIWLLDGAAVESTDTAKLTLNGTGGGGTDAHGVAVNTGRVSSVDGDIHLIGQGGGSTGGFNAGIFLLDGGAIESTGTATITLDGTGGSGTFRNYGVDVADAGTRITSQQGNISITGAGGEQDPSVGDNYGVWIRLGAKVESTGTAQIMIDGTGGDATDGVGLAVNGGSVTSVDGDIAMTGHGGLSPDGIGNLGVWLLNGGLVESTGTAKITLDGTAGSGGVLIRGTQISEGSIVRSLVGDINIKGQGGSGTDGNYGVYLRDGVVESLGTAKIVLNGTGGSGNDANGVILGNNSRVSSLDGNISLTGQGGLISGGTTPRGVAVVSGSVVESTGFAKILIDGTSGLATEGGRGVEIGDAGTKITSVMGVIDITGQGGASVYGIGIWVRSGAVIESTVLAPITLHGTGGNGLDSAGNDSGVILNGFGSGGATQIKSVDGDITIVGIGGNSTTGVDNRGIGIFEGAVIESTHQAKITLDGTGGGIFAASRGVEIGDAGTRVVSVSGDISITGHGGSGTADYGTYNMGVWIRHGAAVQSIGTDNTAAKIAIDGTGHSGTSGDIGVWIMENGRVASVKGDINITGHGGVGTGEYNDGVLLQTGGTIETTSTADITVTGIAGGGTRNVKGVTVEQGARIQSVDGDIHITGQGGTGTDSNFGVAIRTDGAVRTFGAGTGSVQITGTPGTGTGSVGIQIESDSGTLGIDTTAGTGDITLITDSLNIDTIGHPGRVDAGAQTVTIRPLTTGTAIDLGGADAAGTLGITDAELDRVFAGDLIIGDATSGDLMVSADITRTALTDMRLTTGANLLISGGTVDTSGGFLVLDSGDAPDAIHPSHTGIDATASEMSLAGDLSIAINGSAVDTGYSQLNVAGIVNLDGVNLTLSGSYIPSVGESFVIVDSFGVTGKFNGLDEGDTFNFNGALLRISYAGGPDNHDVILTSGNQAPVANDGTLSVTEDLPSDGTLTATDSDSASLTFSIVTGPAHGTVVITDAATGAYTYTPDSNYNGPDSFTFKANDGEVDSNIATISITVDAVNDAPQLNLNGGPVTFSAKAAKKGGPIQIVPNVTVVDVDQNAGFGVGGGTLTISIDVAFKATKKGIKLYDTIGGANASSIGTTAGPAFQNGKLLLNIALHANTTTANIETFLRGMTFTTNGKGTKLPQRIFQAQLTDAAGATSNLLQQTINVTK